MMLLKKILKFIATLFVIVLAGIGISMSAAIPLPNDVNSKIRNDDQIEQLDPEED